MAKKEKTRGVEKLANLIMRRKRENAICAPKLLNKINKLMTSGIIDEKIIYELNEEDPASLLLVSALGTDRSSAYTIFRKLIKPSRNWRTTRRRRSRRTRERRKKKKRRKMRKNTRARIIKERRTKQHYCIVGCGKLS